MPDYKAILSGQSWNALSGLKVAKTPVFLTYTFNGPRWNASKFGSSDMSLARKALKMWGDASGIRFIEVKGEDAELKFQWQWDYGDHSGWAEFPLLERDYFDEGLVRDDDGGNIYLNAHYRSELGSNKGFKLYVLLHEIGHALGLKHPFHRMDYNKQLLKSELDHVNHTVMSYTGADINMQPLGLGALDIQAIRALYGSPSKDGKQVAKWSWSKAAQTLTQIGKSKADVIYGVAVKDVIKGGAGDDRIYSFDGDDTLLGGDGNDVLSGGDGDDALLGEAGNDTLSGSYGDDVLQGGAGSDLLSGGSRNDVLYGDDGNDSLKGGDGNDTLYGGLGSDVLTGNDGSDQFVFDTPFSGIDDVDQIADFNQNPQEAWYDEYEQDKIILSSAIFSTLAKGLLRDEAFVKGAAAQDSTDKILFDPAEQFLSYDPDGTGPLAAVRFAKLLGTVTLNASDFLVV
ncbi:matrixin family metalloprotease [Microvirga mediterraneensis]|uniref:Matrixin family metalloprotease n=1 Tax=Microvirga mediterraneensis TaxID=2754695 RepID=A0A838BQ11_9HYPH|nr:matrixin family metalloprotease [Microvirga mediterraneensis]MBA1157105.1 matrixin family metalloprotease [Microvirga mediterraneensis]